MSEPKYQTRVVVAPSRGTKLCLMAALLILGVGVYVLVVPLDKPTTQGAAFRCGSAVAPESGDFARSVCGGINQSHLMLAALLGFSALVVGLIGLWAFGTDRRTQSRVVEDADEL